jgi:hypothetical protein
MHKKVTAFGLLKVLIEGYNIEISKVTFQNLTKSCFNLLLNELPSLPSWQL